MTYGTWAEAEAALTAVNGNVVMPGGTAPLTVKFADAKPSELAKLDGRGAKRGAWEMGGMGGMMGMMGGGGGSGKRQMKGNMVRARLRWRRALGVARAHARHRPWWG